MSAPAPDPSYVERFVRDVLPHVPGGPQTWKRNPGHVSLIRRAAKDRGLTERIVGTMTYFYDGRWPVGGMSKFQTTLTTGQALVVIRFKHLTKEMLEAAGLPTPAGHVLSSGQVDEAIGLAAAMGTAVLKPSNGGKAEGVTCGITTEAELRTAWLAAEEAAATQADAQFVLEEQVEGIDVRVFVVGGRAVAAATRLNAHVVGDGRRSLADLTASRQESRKENALLASKPIIVDPAMLARRGQTMDDVPADGEIVVLNAVSNIHAGGEAVNVTDIVHPDLMALAADATRAIPGVGAAGVDLMTRDIRSADGAVILELNGPANITVHHCPAHGRPVDVAGAIVDELIATAGGRTRPRASRLRRALRR